MAQRITILDSIFKGVPAKDRSFLARQLSVLLDSGVQITEAVSLIRQQTKSHILANALEHIEADLQGGYSFTDSIRKYPNIFPDIFINVVAAGETSGKLSVTLNMLTEELERDQGFKGRIVGALLYPGFIVGAMIVVGILMTVKIIPSLAEVFKESNTTLPWTTTLIITMTNSFIHYWYAYILGVIFVFYVFFRSISSLEGKKRASGILLEIPLISALITNMEMARFARTLAMLIKSGVPILKALESVDKVISNVVFRDILKDVAYNVERGATISHTLSKYKAFPITVTQMISVGESSGKLEEMLNKLAAYYETETDQQIKNISALIEPIIFVIVGLGVAFMVFSIIVPIYNLSGAMQ